MLQIFLYVEATLDPETVAKCANIDVSLKICNFFLLLQKSRVKGLLEIHRFWESGASFSHVKC